MKSLLLLICIIATLGLEIEGAKIKRQLKLAAVCSGKDGILVAMPGSCSGFFFCIKGNAIASSCGSFYQFNPILGICDHPWKVSCTDQTSAPAPIRQVSTDAEAMYICAQYAPEGYMFGKSNTCSQSYVCRDNIAVRRICPPQRHFNLESKMCEDVGLAVCEYDKPLETFAVVPPTMAALRKPEEGHKSPVHVSELSVYTITSLCSEAKENTTVAHPWDCGKFVYCLKERTMILSCPNGLHFNSQKQRCEWPSVAQCLM